MKIQSFLILSTSFFALAQEKSTGESIKELDALTIESTPLDTTTIEVSQAWSVLDEDKEMIEVLQKIRVGNTVCPQVQQFIQDCANQNIVKSEDKFKWVLIKE